MSKPFDLEQVYIDLKAIADQLEEQGADITALDAVLDTINDRLNEPKRTITNDQWVKNVTRARSCIEVLHDGPCTPFVMINRALDLVALRPAQYGEAQLVNEHGVIIHTGHVVAEALMKALDIEEPNTNTGRNTADLKPE